MSTKPAADPFAGYQQVKAYHLRRNQDDPGVPLSKIHPRALMIPPGIPDFYTRQRSLPVGAHTVAGRAWSGSGRITTVEVSFDGGGHWHEAHIEAPELGPWAWQAWSYEWEADTSGAYTLCCRASDAMGHGQADGAGWNVGGYSNPAPQRVHVVVHD